MQLALNRINGNGKDAALDRCVGLSRDAEAAAWGYQWSNQGLYQELLNRVRPQMNAADVNLQQWIIRTDADKDSVYVMDMYGQQDSDGYVVAHQAQMSLTIEARRRRDLQNRVDALLTYEYGNNVAPTSVISMISVDGEIRGQNPVYSADVVYHITLPAVKDIANLGNGSWCLLYEASAFGTGARYDTARGERINMNLVAVVIGRDHTARNAIVDRMVGWQPNEFMGLTEVNSQVPIQLGATHALQFWRCEFSNWLVNRGD